MIYTIQFFKEKKLEFTRVLNAADEKEANEKACAMLNSDIDEYKIIETKDTASCEHLHFQSTCEISRRTNNDGTKVLGYSADIRIHCVDCGHAFEFIGVDRGISPSYPTVNIDGIELRAPIRPCNDYIEEAENKIIN